MATSGSTETVPVPATLIPPGSPSTCKDSKLATPQTVPSSGKVEEEAYTEDKEVGTATTLPTSEVDGLSEQAKVAINRKRVKTTNLLIWSPLIFESMVNIHR